MRRHSRSSADLVAIAQPHREVKTSPGSSLRVVTWKVSLIERELVSGAQSSLEIVSLDRDRESLNTADAPHFAAFHQFSHESARNKAKPRKRLASFVLVACGPICRH